MMEETMTKEKERAILFIREIFKDCLRQVVVENPLHEDLNDLLIAARKKFWIAMNEEPPMEDIIFGLDGDRIFEIRVGGGSIKLSVRDEDGDWDPPLDPEEKKTRDRIIELKFQEIEKWMSEAEIVQVSAPPS